MYLHMFCLLKIVLNCTYCTLLKFTTPKKLKPNITKQIQFLQTQKSCGFPNQINGVTKEIMYKDGKERCYNIKSLQYRTIFCTKPARYQKQDFQWP